MLSGNELERYLSEAIVMAEHVKRHLLPVHEEVYPQILTAERKKEWMIALMQAGMAAGRMSRAIMAVAEDVKSKGPSEW